MKYSNYGVEDFLTDELFIKWVKGNDPNVHDFWKKWMTVNSEKAHLLKEAAEIIMSLEYEYKYELNSEEYIDLYEGITSRSRSMERNKVKYGRIGWGIAAALVLALTSLAIIRLQLWSPKSDYDNVVEVRTITKTALAGQKLSFRLPDGTMVKLNASSSLQFPDKMDSAREVILLGEAFFDVIEDPNHPFRVLTRDFSTTALGTSFNVFAYNSEKKHKVSLISGSVKVKKTAGADSYSRILQPGDQVTYDAAAAIFSIEPFDVNSAILWTEGILVFQDNNFSDVISTLERWYGVSIDVLNENNKRRDKFSGTFNNESLERVLEVLSFSGGFTFKIEEKLVLIEFLNK